MSFLSGLIGPLISGVSGIFGGMFTTKQKALEAGASVASNITDLINNTNSTDAQIATAIASVVTAEANSESWLTRTWRPLVMWCITVCVICYFFGYKPPNIDVPMSDMMREIFDLLKYGIMGYMPCRTVDKIATLAFKTKLFNNILSALTSGKIKLQ